MSFGPRFLATGIGSMPFEDVGYAVDVCLKRLGEAPFWPQLPRLGLCEQMCPQYTEGMPCVVLDEAEKRVYFDTSGDSSEALTGFYEHYIAAMDPDAGSGDCSAMAISEDYSRGLYAFESRLKADGAKLPFVKVHATGPCTIALTLTDENKQLIYYNEAFRDVIVKAIAMKCRWQIQKFAPFAERVICFLDEPALSAYGTSTYISVARDDVVSLLNEAIEAIHADGGLAGIHCCGNTEWSILIDAGVDIVNFDAFDFGHTIALYAGDVKEFLERGGVLAWGVVPTSDVIRSQSAEGLADHLEKMMDSLAGKGIDKATIAEQAIITPSCGTGSMDAADAEKVFELTGELSQIMRKRYGF
ncbi:MAG: hypothetical protein KAR47_20855 [Planctomycetes bacterium]|nr:hypothetical protein [Planctomycetota bacterium]